MSRLARLLRRDPPPADAVSRLDADERVVSWAGAPGGAAVVATQRGLWLPAAGPGKAGPERLLWHLIGKAVWRDGALTVYPVDDVGDGVLADRPAVSVRLSEPRDLPPTVRTRVERSIAFTRHHRLPTSGGVRVVGRRVAGLDGLAWQLAFDPGTDRDDPLVRMQAGQLVEQARAETAAPD